MIKKCNQESRQTMDIVFEISRKNFYREQGQIHDVARNIVQPLAKKTY